MTTFKGPGCYGPFGPIRVFLILKVFSQHPGQNRLKVKYGIIKSVIYHVSCQVLPGMLNVVSISDFRSCYVWFNALVFCVCDD